MIIVLLGDLVIGVGLSPCNVVGIGGASYVASGDSEPSLGDAIGEFPLSVGASVPNDGDDVVCSVTPDVVSPGGKSITLGGTSVGNVDGGLPEFVSLDGDVVCSDGIVPPDSGAPVLVSPVGGMKVGDADGVLPSFISSGHDVFSSACVVALDGESFESIMSGGMVVGDVDGADGILPSLISPDSDVVCSDVVVPPGGGVPVLISPVGESVRSGGTAVGDADGIRPSLISPDGDVVCSDAVDQ